MRGTAGRLGRSALALPALLLCALPARAAAQGLSLQAEPSYSSGSTRTTDQAGNVTQSDSQQVLQRYRGSYDRSYFPYLRFSADGTYEWALGWNTADGTTSQLDARKWSLGGTVNFGSPVLGGAVSYNLREESAEASSLGQTSRSPTLIREALGASASWRPFDLPTLDLRYARSHNYDSARQAADLLTDEVSLATTFKPSAAWDLRYSARYANAEDRLTGVTTADVAQAAAVSWNARFLEGRVATYAGYSAGARTSRTTVAAGSTGGDVLTQQFPVAGLSAVETFPALPDQVKLAQNPALIDGNPTAGAGLDIGFAPWAANDRNYRDAGVQLANLITPVNRIRLWVNQQLPAAVWGAFAFTVWQSGDNQTWTQVPLAGTVSFDPFQSFFEIPIQETSAFYLKVTTRPLDSLVTTDSRYASILIAEIQLFRAVRAAEAADRGTETRASGQLNATARVLILKEANLAYDSSFVWAHSDHPWRVTWNVVNGLSASRRLSPLLLGSARVERADSDSGTGHEGQTRLSGSLAAEFLPTLSAGLTYSAQTSQRRAGNATSHGANLFGRAELYHGLDLTASGGVGTARAEDGRETVGANVSVGMTVAPHRTLSITGNYAFASSTITGGGRPPVHDDRGRVEGTLSFSPFPALYVSAAASRFTSGQAPSTLASFSAGFSPFPGGNLVSRFGYTETLDTGSDSRTRSWGPGLRWNVRPGLWTDVSYSVTDSRTPAMDVSSRFLFATLTLLLR